MGGFRHPWQYKSGMASTQGIGVRRKVAPRLFNFSRFIAVRLQLKV
jgi:hypothetical protein